MSKTEPNDGSSKIDKLLAELENETLPEDSSILDKQIKQAQTDENIEPKTKYEKPDWADKKDDDMNTYEYVEKDIVEDNEW